jgi:hypothetical protein
VRLPDSSRYQSVAPDDIATYLRALGWVADQDQPAWTRGNIEVWTNHATEGQVLVPLQPSFRDYAERVADFCATIADEYSIEPLQVLRQVLAVGYDVICLRVRLPDGSDALPLSDAVVLVKEGRTMISAVAASAVESRPSHPKARPPEVRRYLDRLQMAQTERGSFVLAIRSPIDILATDPNEPEQLRFSDDPSGNGTSDQSGAPDTHLSGRTMTRTLVGAVSAAINALPFLQRHEYNRFDEVVHAGVSSNLYDALFALARVGADAVELSVRWSPRAALDIDDSQWLRRPLILSRTQRRWFREAAERLRSLTDVVPIRITGQVVQLHRDPAAFTGVVVVKATVAGTQQLIRLVLSLTDYDLALAAHDARRNLSCSGIARKRGRYLVIEVPTDVAIEDET